MKRALITGITGQDGGYLAEWLLEQGYEVFGLVRQTSIPADERLRTLQTRVQLVAADLLDQGSLTQLLREIQPHEIYNLAAQSFVPTSFQQPIGTGDVTGLGVTRLLHAMLQEAPLSRFYQASSSEMFGKVRTVPQSESTPFYPRSPYGAAKAYAHYMTVNYRESYGLFACSGILFNHESPRRGPQFVTRKISLAVARILLGIQKKLKLGNLDAYRDWGFAGDYVRAMWLMLQQSQPDDFVVGTGEMHSVREFVSIAFQCVGLDWERYVEIDPELYRPAEVEQLCADPSKAKSVLGWQPAVTFQELVEMMVHHDVILVGRQAGRYPGRTSHKLAYAA